MTSKQVIAKFNARSGGVQSFTLDTISRRLFWGNIRYETVITSINVDGTNIRNDVNLTKIYSKGQTTVLVSGIAVDTVGRKLYVMVDVFLPPFVPVLGCLDLDNTTNYHDVQIQFDPFSRSLIGLAYNVTTDLMMIQIIPSTGQCNILGKAEQCWKLSPIPQSTFHTISRRYMYINEPCTDTANLVTFDVNNQLIIENSHMKPGHLLLGIQAAN
eukprot:TRINITY_DN11772_c0_g1_i2.p1 TRINITY_DN11772_c0_g1~~TRINITY_DN11772_c0_g1_i2.p1  ORF type:complete len:214 (+),score=21.52 TRINITY_DN11772_c0_g1_i2:289-930(+)